MEKGELKARLERALGRTERLPRQLSVMFPDHPRLTEAMRLSSHAEQKEFLQLFVRAWQGGNREVFVEILPWLNPHKFKWSMVEAAGNELHFHSCAQGGLVVCECSLSRPQDMGLDAGVPLKKTIFWVAGRPEDLPIF